MGKRWVFLVCFVVSLCSLAWAQRGNNIKKEVADPSGFTDTIDITRRKKGKYNYLFEAKDRAGNVTHAGPENFWIDPESDLPVTSIVNPLPNMHVQGNLNIVGMAVDDDGISAVDLRVYRGRGTQGQELVFTRASGRDFWSFFLDTTNGETWTDGEYTITAWATDTNGLIGNLSNASQFAYSFKPKQHKVHQVTWHLDRKKPDITISSHENGALVRGKIRIKGTTFDGNKIKSMSYSLDDGESYLPIKTKPDKKTNRYSWEFDVDTKSIEDGPAVVYIKAVDGMGTVGEAVQLFFVNNTPPEVKIVHPEPKEAVYGVFTVAGLATHPVGIKTLTWKSGKLSGAIEQAVGDPLWAVDIDLREQKTSSVAFEIRAEDVMGNVTVAKSNIKVDTNLATPRITLNEPVAKSTPKTANGSIYVRGTAKSAEGMRSVFYSVNGGEGVEVITPGFFQFVIPNLPEGIYMIEVWGKSSTGIIGPKTTVKGINVSNIADSSGGPAISLRDVPSGRWVQNSFNMRLGVSGAARVSYSLDMGASWIDLPNAADITRTVDISELEDGAITVLIKAENNSEQVTISHFTALKKTQAVDTKVVMPIAEMKVNGKISLGFAIKEPGALKSVTYTRGTTTRRVFSIDNWDKNYLPKFIRIQTDPTQMPLDKTMRFVFEDLAGNTSAISEWDFIIDNEMDIPVVQVLTPAENEVVTSDFIISGIMYDDDKVARVHYSIDGGAQRSIEADYAFNIPIRLNSLTDNEHFVTVIAEDVYGVRSQPERRNFKVSLAEPTATVAAPTFDAILKEEIEIRGTAADRNGIEEVRISVDNGNTFNLATGKESWSYRFNSAILKDGPHVVFIKVMDRYEVSATYSSMINVDNTPPDVILDSPNDGSMTAGRLAVMGRVLDPNLESISIEIRGLQGGGSTSRRLGVSNTIREVLDIRSFSDGVYNLEVLSRDKAGNQTRTSRNIEIAKSAMRDFVEILYPLSNEDVQGNFNVYGYAGGTNKAGTATIRVNGVDRKTEQVAATGYFRFSLGPEDLAAGNNTIMVYSSFEGASTVQSAPRTIAYKSAGPWITIDNLRYGQFAYDRPFLSGRTGYIVSEEDKAKLASKETPKDAKEEIKAKKPVKTEISFDNGKTFHKTAKGIGRKVNYRYRIETDDMKEGIHYILVRTTMKNEEVTVSRLIVQVDKTHPVIRLVAPEASEHYNQQMIYSAAAFDDVELASLVYHLRKGDKNLYGLPGFLQGLYVESIIPPIFKQTFKGAPNVFAGGATYMDVGLGLSFFDNNVKIQGNYGFITQEQYESLGGEGPLRYGGQVLGIKLLANVYNLPFGSFAGPGWKWLSATLAVGANFSLFDLMQEGYTQSGKSTWMSALLAQIEFPKVTMAKWKYFRNFSVFTEGQLWFVPTDVDAGSMGIDVIIPHLIVGVRMYVF